MAKELSIKKSKHNQLLTSTNLIVLLLLISMLLSACQPFKQPVSVSENPSPEITSSVSEDGIQAVDQGEPLPPIVIDIFPSGAQELPLDGNVQLTFDQAMDTQETESAWQMTSPDGTIITGDFTWSNQSTLQFAPRDPLQPGSIYRATLTTQAASADGVHLSNPLDFKILSISELQVSQVFPANGSTEVENNVVITVIFNRPVAPLVVAEEQQNLPQPLIISPTIPGEGEWVNTSVYTYHPSQPLEGGATYTVMVNKGLQDAAQETSLAEDFSWNFSTAAPAIESLELSTGAVNPNNYLTKVLLDTYFTLHFLQPMDKTSTLNALSLTTQKGDVLGLTSSWNEEGTTLIITPTVRLALGTQHALKLDDRALAAGGGNLREGLNWNFITVPSPAILSVEPYNGQVQSNFSSELRLQFASPMDIESVKKNIRITPTPPSDAQWWYNEYDWSMSFYALQPSIRYQVSFHPGMMDIYGNQITQGQTISFLTAPYPPSASLQMPYQPALFRSDAPPEAQQFYANYQNVSRLEFQLYKLSPQTLASFLVGEVSPYEYRPPEADLVWRLEEKSAAPLNKSVLKSYSLATEDKPLQRGIYFLALDAPEVPRSENVPFTDYRYFIVANGNLTFKTTTNEAMVWLTDLTTGKPVSAVPITVYGMKSQEIGRNATDVDGLAQIELPTPADPYENRYAIAQNDQVFAFASSAWESGLPLYDYGIWGSYYAPANQPKAYLYTERPIYRPGQPVFFKGILRMDNDLDYTLPTTKTINVRISNYKETVFEADLPLNSFGSFDGELKLDSEAALGFYNIEARFPGSEAMFGSVAFNVAEYIRPEFQVKVSAEPANVLQGETFVAKASASYYSGGAVSAADVDWSLTSEPFNFTPPEEYLNYSFSDIESDAGYYEGFEQSPTDQIAQGSGKTDEKGEFSKELVADLGTYKRSRTLTFEATINDISKNSVSGRASVIAHLSQVYPGVKPQTYVGTEGEEQAFDLIALDWNGKPLPSQKVNVEIVERRWYSVQEQDASGRVEWKSTVEEIPVESLNDVILDENGEASVKFTPQKGGVYRAIVTSLDEKGNTGRASAYLWVAGKEFIPWRQTNDRKFDLVVDKPQYLPGETAEILIASPFQGEAYALVTVERGRIHQQDVILLTNNSTIYTLPIATEMAPNIFVSVLIVKGIDENNPRPSYKMGIVEIKVDTREQEIKVEVTPDREQAGPSEKVLYSVRTTDSQGKPISAELSLGLSDLATLSLTEPNSPPILDFFYSKRTLGVWTSIPLNTSIEEYNEQVSESIAQGPSMGAGGGKGGGEVGVIEVREEFPDTAYWNAYVVTDENGQASVSITLPDNLTTWRMDARAATLETQVGQATQDIVTSKPLLVRPQTPRFFVAGDEARLGALVQNNTDQAVTTTVNLSAEGLTLRQAAEQSVKIAPNGRSYVTWNTSVNPDATRVDLVMSAKGVSTSGEEYLDASRPPQGTLDQQGIPVYRYEAHETQGTSGMMVDAGDLVEAIWLPQTMDVSQGDLTVKVSPSLAAGMTDGLAYLEHFPYECVEQTISRFLPNVMVTQALEAAGLSDPKLEAGLKIQVNLALQRLYNLQNPDGGWGWWSNQKSDPLTSAYVVLGLVEAKDAGYAVDQDVLERGVNYLRTQLKWVSGLEDPALVNRQSFILYVLAKYGKPDISKSVQLYQQRQRMALYARAFLAEDLYLIDPDDKRVETLLSDFNNAAITSASGTHWEEQEIDRYNWNTDIRTTAIILSTVSLIDPQNPLNANAVRWLMSNRTDGHWNGTQETAWTLMALTNWMEASGEMNADYRYGVALNNNQLGGGVADETTLRQSQEFQVDIAEMLKDEANRLAISRDEGPGNLYYTAFLNVFLPVEEVDPLDQGIVISRSYYNLDNLNTPITQAKQGDLVLGRLTLVTPHDLHYVVVDDPLPAGLEGVDQSLATSPQSVEVPQVYSYEDAFWRGWGWWSFDNVQMRDEKVVLSASYLPAGTYVYTYLARAGTAGTFRTIPPTAQEFYFPDVYGRGAGSLFTVNP